MKIGIITQPLRNNYGGLLQNYALQQILITMGHTPITIDWDGRNSLRERLWRIKQRLLAKFDENVQVPRYVPSKREDKIISQNTDNFIRQYIKRTPTAYSANKLSKRAHNERVDAYIVGSDQVWRPGFNAFPLSMFLDFAEADDVRRIAYAASFGTDKWEFKADLTAYIAKLANKFDLITVREASGVKLCKDYLMKEAHHVLDPTMLLEKSDYEEIVKKAKQPISNGNLFYYILDPTTEKKDFISQVSQKHKLNSFTVLPTCQQETRTKDDIKNRIEDCVFPSVESWLRAFMDAEMVIVDSFHGTVFSILFNKPFWVISNSHRGNARFESLLDLFDLRSRMVKPGDLNVVENGKSINWEIVNETLRKERARCINLLTNALIKNDSK